MMRKRTMNQLGSTPMRIPKTLASWMDPPPSIVPLCSGASRTRERNPVAHRVTFIPGDGTGPELAEATRRVLEATGVGFEWDFQDAGVDVYESEGNPLPDRTLDSIRERGIAIKGPTTTPVGSGHRSINVALRKEFD